MDRPGVGDDEVLGRVEAIGLDRDTATTHREGPGEQDTDLELLAQLIVVGQRIPVIDRA
jgi:hypothetical protein